MRHPMRPCLILDGIWAREATGISTCGARATAHYPRHAYRDHSPNAAELLLLSVAVIIVGCVAQLYDSGPSCNIVSLGFKMIAAVFVANIVHDAYRHLWRDYGRTTSLETSVAGFRWLLAVLESTPIRVFSECGRLVGVLERGEVRYIGKRFEWFVGKAGNGPMDEERRNSVQKAALWVLAVSVAMIQTTF